MLRRTIIPPLSYYMSSACNPNHCLRGQCLHAGDRGRGSKRRHGTNGVQANERGAYHSISRSTKNRLRGIILFTQQGIYLKLMRELTEDLGDEELLRPKLAHCDLHTVRAPFLFV